MIKVGIIGATGYTGIELLRILHGHPQAEVCYAATESYAGDKLSHTYPHLKNITQLLGEKLDLEKIPSHCDLIFIALPHGFAAKIVGSLLDAGKKVIDLGADLRLQNPADYQQWYQQEAASVALLQRAIYGLPEAGFRSKIKTSTLIANPGCYATASILAATPLLTSGLIDLNDCILDGKSGISGAGRSLALNSHFSEAAENFKAYQIAGTHRHTPEIEQAFQTINGNAMKVEFTPHLVPMVRGLFMTAYFKLNNNAASEQQVRELYQHYYQDEPFIRVLPAHELPQTKNVRGTNYCDIAIRVNSRTQRITVTSVIDNLVKGASGQAVQNMNLICQLPETLGLNNLQAIYP